MSTYTYVPSQCFVFIKQSNSPGFFQFWIKHYDIINLNTPESIPTFIISVLQSHTLSQTYGAILPTSLTYFLLQHQRLLTLETCCGHWYGRLWTPRIKSKQPWIPFVFEGSIANMSLYSQRLEIPNSPPTPSSLIDSIQRICVQIPSRRNNFKHHQKISTRKPKLFNNIQPYSKRIPKAYIA